MKTYAQKARGAGTWLTAGVLFWTLSSAFACSSKDDNPAPSKGGKAGTQGGSGGGNQSGGAENSGGNSDVGGASGNPGTGGSGEEGGTKPGGGTDAGGAAGGGGEGVAGGGGEGGSDGSTTCPATELEFLNRPSTSQCSAFPNTKARLPALNADGSLPPLPGA